MATEKIRILLVDDHSMVIEGMKAILGKIDGVSVVANASNAFEAIAKLKAITVDIAFIDINLPDVSGIELCSKINKEYPHIRMIALSTFKQRSYITQMIGNGASGYLLKSADKEEIEAAIHAVKKDKMYFSTGIANSSEAENEDEAPTLTKREKEIMQLIAEGITSNEIAVKLFLSIYTVDTHRKNLLTKFEVNNTALLIKMATKFGIV